jgi:hypothetical protein
MFHNYFKPLFFHSNMLNIHVCQQSYHSTIRQDNPDNQKARRKRSNGRFHRSSCFADYPLKVLKLDYTLSNDDSACAALGTSVRHTLTTTVRLATAALRNQSRTGSRREERSRRQKDASVYALLFVPMLGTSMVARLVLI